jgi:VWFA-related protein
MSKYACIGSFILASFFIGATVPAQQPGAPAPVPSNRIYLNVVVTPKSGAPVSGLQKKDFTLLDNKVPETITSFQEVPGRDAPIEIILVIDAVNADLQALDYERIEIDKFLQNDKGNLAYPIALAIVNDTGVTIVGGKFSSDGNELSASLMKEIVGLRAIKSSAGLWGATERLQLSISALGQIVDSEAPRPGRKLIFWVSPGWPLLNVPGVEFDARQQQKFFATLVHTYTNLIKGGITLYSIDPLGAGENTLRASDYEQFLKGVSKSSQVQIGNLGLQVIAIHSGGLAVGPDNDIAGLVKRCVADSAPYYEISFDPPEADGPNEYHHLEVKVDTPGLTARTHEEYYAQPPAQK